MVTTVRELVIQNIVTTLQGISGIGTVDRNNINPLQFRQYPVALVIPDSDTVLQDIGGENAPYGKSTRDLDVEILLWVRGTKEPERVIEEFIGKVQAAMMADLDRGGKAISTREKQIENVYSDEATMERGARVFFAIKYRHSLQDPTIG